MSLKSVIFSFILMAVATKCLVQGLQCYVCEDCNEYEDFKELHICGEIPIVGTATAPGPLEGSATNKPEIKPTLKPAVKPTPEKPDDYLDSEESHDEVSALNSGEKTTTKSTTTATETPSKTTTKPANTATQSKPTTKPAITNTNSKTTTKPTTTATKSKTTTKPSATATVTTKPTTLTETAQKETTNKTTTANTTTTTSSTAAAVATATKPKPVALPDYDDYLEYEDAMERRSAKSLLKINEPVCYMIKYQVNNTVFTNRGCTSFINANKYLTCQTLYNGAPMESCRICSSNGCNKFLSGESEEDDHGISITAAAGVMEKLGIVVSLILILINRCVF